MLASSSGRASAATFGGSNRSLHAVSDNETNQFALGQGRYPLGGDVPAVPRRDYAVRKRKHLLEAMGHVEGEQAVALEAIDDAEQPSSSQVVESAAVSSSRMRTCEAGQRARASSTICC